MAYETTTALLGLPIWQGSDRMQHEDWNEAWTKIEDALGDFDYIISHYGYTMDIVHKGGGMTITLTAGKTCPEEATLTAQINPDAEGNTAITVTVKIGEATTTETHALNVSGGKGGPV